MLSGPEIERQIQGGDIAIEPYDSRFVGPNSVDVHLMDQLRVYDRPSWLVRQFLWLAGRPWCLDPHQDNPTRTLLIPPDGVIIWPGELYLGSTVERTECGAFVPRYDGRSSVGRLSIRTHQTAGFGDAGFCGRWTLEIDCVLPVRLYPGMRIGQVSFTPLMGQMRPYTGRYQNQSIPTSSRFHEVLR